MKKIFLNIVLMSMVFVFCLCGCNKQGELSAYIVDNSIEGTFQNASNSATFGLWSSENMNLHIEASAPKSHVVTFDGKSYQGTYKYSQTVLKTNYRTDSYSFDGGDFEINASTGELTFIRFSIPEIREKTISLEQGEKIAAEIASQYISIDGYRLFTTDHTSYYNYTYVKEIDGIETSEMLSISLELDGTLQRIRLQMINEFSSNERKAEQEQRIKQLMNQKNVNLVEEKIKECYPIISKENIPYKISDKWFVLDENDNLCMLYKVEIDSVFDDSGHPIFNGMLNYIVVK